MCQAPTPLVSSHATVEHPNRTALTAGATELAKPLTGRLPRLTSSPHPPRVPRSTCPRKGSEGVQVLPLSEPRGGCLEVPPDRYTFPTLKLEPPGASQRRLTGTLLVPCPLEAIMRISLKSMLTGSDRMGQALGEEGVRVLPPAASCNQMNWLASLFPTSTRHDHFRRRPRRSARPLPQAALYPYRPIAALASPLA